MNAVSLLILALVAAFLFYKLRSILGQTPYDPQEKNKERQKKLATLSDRFNEKIKPINQPSDANDDIVSEHSYIKSSTEEEKKHTQDVIADIKNNYQDFTVPKFIEGVQGTYDMILESFNKNLPEDMKNFLAPEIYNGYRRLLDDYQSKGYKFETIVTRIDNVMIVSAYSDEKVARIVAEINAYNISVLKDAEGNVIEGNPDKAVKVTDTWTFERLYTTTSPVWFVVKTSI